MGMKIMAKGDQSFETRIEAHSGKSICVACGVSLVRVWDQANLPVSLDRKLTTMRGPINRHQFNRHIADFEKK